MLYIYAAAMCICIYVIAMYIWYVMLNACMNIMYGPRMYAIFICRT